MLLNELLTTPAPLRQWLESQPEGAVVGEANDKCKCPTVQFLRAAGVDVWSVSYFGIMSAGHKREPVPYWLFEFIERIDDRSSFPPDWDHLNMTVEVTREEALRVLAEVAPDE